MADRLRANSRLSSSRSTPSSRASLASASVYMVTRGESNSMSVGMTASAPYTRKKGVKLDDLFGVVRRLQRTAGSSSSQQPAERSSGTTSHGLMPERMRPLARSTWPFDCGWATDAKSSQMPCVAQKCAKAPLAKFVPLSVMRLGGTPYRVVISAMNVTAVSPFSFLIGFASIHLVNLSTATRRCVMPPRAVLNGPTMSRPQTTKGQVRGMVLSAEADRCCLELKTWHPLQCLTNSLASSKAVGQKNPWRKALATSDLEAAWWPHSPWWMSLRIAMPFSCSTHSWKTPVTLRLASSLLTIVYASARRWTCLASVSSAGSSWFVRKLRMGWAHDGAVTSSIANAATATRVGGLGCEMLESAAACCAGAVPGPTTAVHEPGSEVPGLGASTE